MLDFIKKIWRDPVGSKVIATGIILALTALVTLLTHALTYSVPIWSLLATFVISICALAWLHWLRTIRGRKPQLHMAWHGSAGWGIGGLLNKDGMESVLRIQGPVVITSSHLTESVIVTGIELKGAEYAGPYFQMFEVNPGETIKQHLMLNFRGLNPAKGRALTVNLSFVDIKGDRYRLKPAALRAFPGLDNPARESPSPQESRTSPPSPHPAFPLDGEDGVHREIILYIMHGQDQLLAYKTSRDGFPGTRFLVVRARPNQSPQSVDTPDQGSANAKWNEWYLEWKKKGFGGAFGNGLDGAPPF